MTRNPAEQLLSDLKQAKVPADYHRALKRVYLELGKLHDSVITSRSVHLDCRDGCSLCCYLRVDVSAPEVFLIVEFVRSTFTQKEQTELSERLSVHAERVSKITTKEHFAQNIPCPLLKDGRCSVYPVRPFGCRRHHAQDFGTCQYSFDHPKDLDFQGSKHPELTVTMEQAAKAVLSAYRSNGCDQIGYELGAVLREALSNSSTWRRWRDKKKTFLSAPMTPTNEDM